MITLSNRAHLFARPDTEEDLTAFFTDIFGCAATAVPGTSIVAFRFPNGASVSVDFTADALAEGPPARGAWLEVQTDDPLALEGKVRAAGLPLVDYATGRFYFRAPGGQVWGILPLREP
jgi:hypothetical protein